MNKLLILIIVIAFVFVVSYDPKKGKPLPEFYQPAPPSAEQASSCDESRFLELQGLPGVCAGGHPKEIGGAVYSR